MGCSSPLRNGAKRETLPRIAGGEHRLREGQTLTRVVGVRVTLRCLEANKRLAQ